VSGQNVMLLAALALPLLVAAGAGPRLRALVLLVLIAVYVPLAGGGPSLQRAGAMGAAGAIALAAGRVSSRWYALLLAAVVTLVMNPRSAEDAGWQLSFVAVLGILVLGGRLRESLAGVVPRPVAEAIAITVAATVSTAPLVAHHFGSVSVAGLIANLVALPVVAPIMWLGMSAAALAQIPAVVPELGGPVDAVTGWLGAIDGLLLGYLAWVARVFGEAPGATLALPLRSPFAVAAAYAAIAVVAVIVARRARRAEPRFTSSLAAWRRAPADVRFAGVVAGAGAVALALVAWTGTPSPPKDLTVSFLDVGQGDATLIQDGAGASVLFDGGPPEASVYRQLRRLGVSRLDLMVSTHQSRDHQGGLHGVLERVPVRAMVENGYGTADPDYHRLLMEARARGVPITTARAGQVYRVGRLTITVFGPRPRAPGEPPPEDPNPIGVAAIVSEGDFDLWLSADAESDAILQYPLRPVEAM
jgi:competence protein ComEC